MRGWEKAEIPRLTYQPFTSTFCPCQGRKQGWNDSLVLPSPSIVQTPVLSRAPAIPPVPCSSSGVWWRCTVEGLGWTPGPGQHDWSVWSCKWIPGMCLLWSLWSLACARFVQCFPPGCVVNDCLSLSCFSCLNSSTDSLPTCFCSAGYTGNGTHCTGVSSKDKVKQMAGNDRGKITQILFLSATHHELWHALGEMFSSPELYTGGFWCC